MNFIDQQFHRQQKRLQTRKPVMDDAEALQGRQHVAPLFTAAVLCTDTPLENEERLIVWLQRRIGVKAQTVSDAVSQSWVKAERDRKADALAKLRRFQEQEIAA